MSITKLTNKSGLPPAIVKALENDPYDAGDSDFTATSLIKPSRLWALEKLHAHEIQEDAEDGLYRLYGQVAHGILERANMADLAEKRFFTEIAGKRISAQLDTLSFSNGELSDFKFTTSWGFKQDTPPKPEWVAQLNIQLELLRRNELDATSLKIIGLLRDWQFREAKFNPNYPQAPVAVLSIPMWSREQTVSFIEMRIASHLAALKDLPLCTTDERWAKPDQWAVVKSKRAINGGVQLSEQLAEAICAKNPGTRVEFRRGESVRCGTYCKVSKFCSQFQSQSAITPADEGEKNAI